MGHPKFLVKYTFILRYWVFQISNTPIREFMSKLVRKSMGFTQYGLLPIKRPGCSLTTRPFPTSKTLTVSYRASFALMASMTASLEVASTVSKEPSFS